MALEKVISVDLIEVIENGLIQVRTKTSIKENGVELSNSFHRHTVIPGADYSAENDRVKAVCSAVQTPEVIAEYQAAQAALEAARLSA